MPWVQSRSDYAVAREYPVTSASDSTPADGGMPRQCSATPATSARSLPSSGGAEQGAQRVSHLRCTFRANYRDLRSKGLGPFGFSSVVIVRTWTIHVPPLVLLWVVYAYEDSLVHVWRIASCARDHFDRASARRRHLRGQKYDVPPLDSHRNVSVLQDCPCRMMIPFRERCTTVAVMPTTSGLTAAPYRLELETSVRRGWWRVRQCAPLGSAIAVVPRGQS